MPIKLISFTLCSIMLVACQTNSEISSTPHAKPSKSVVPTTSSPITSSTDIASHFNNFNFIGKYETPIEKGGSYKQTLSIIPTDNNANDSYEVSFWASLVKGKPNCQFTGQGWIEDDTLWVDISRGGNKQVLMYIKPLADKSGVDVFTRDFDERFTMMWYCGGGGSLAGTYIKIN